jgi:undecaprenyl pyrophosphate phosphatase UppP
LIIGFAASFVVGLAALLLLLSVVKRGRLALFSIYLLPAAILSLIFI